MGFVVARWWTFGNPFPPCRNLVALLHELSEAEGRRISTLTFDGRRFVSGRFDGLGDIRKDSFPLTFARPTSARRELVREHVSLPERSR